jgi:hypothetical protein
VENKKTWYLVERKRKTQALVKLKNKEEKWRIGRIYTE